MNRTTLLLLALCLVLGSSIPSFAGKGCCGGPESTPPTRKGRALDGPARRGGDPATMMLHVLKGVQPPLTEAQIEQVNKIAEETRAQLNTATTPQERREIVTSMRSRIIQTVLTEEQRASLRARAPHVPPGPSPTPGIGHAQPIFRFFERVQPPLTDVQREQIAKLSAEARPKLHNAQSPQERRAIHAQLRKTIMQTVLTEEQRASLREQRKHYRKRMHKHEAPHPPAEAPTPPAATE